MPILMTKKVDRQALYLNENAYAVYIEAHDKAGGDPWTRWARNFQRCLPLTMWQHFGQQERTTSHIKQKHRHLY